MFSWAVAPPTTEKEFIARTIMERARESNLNPERMLRIAICESGLEIKANNPRTIDRGLFQINKIHDPLLKQMRIDPFNYKDNIDFAIWLAQRDGYTPWNASIKCQLSLKLALSSP